MENIEYLVKYREKRQFVEVSILKIVTTDLAEEIVTESVKLARKNSCDSFLFDARGAFLKADIWKSYKLFAYPEKMGFIRSDKIALLVEKDKPIYKFAETVATNRGWTLRCIDDELEANEWLQTENGSD